MTSFKPGDKVVVVNPIQPTVHQGGEIGVVTSVGSVAGVTVVQIRDDHGRSVGVHPDEIRKR